MFFEYYVRENPRFIRHLLPICKQWYELAISSPRLWNRIPIKYFESDWDIETISESVKRRLDKCIDLSGNVSLELDLDFGELTPPQNLITSQIREYVSNYTLPDGQDTLNEWILGLNVDLLNDPEVISACQPHHLFELLENLIGKDGEIAPWWVSLRLDLPEETELALGILKLFSHPTPNLTRLQISGFSDIRGEYATLVGSIFPNVSALEHLEIPNAADLEVFKFDPTLLQILTFNNMKSCDPSIFTSFIRLRQLEVFCWSLLGQARESHGVVHLPELRRLSVRGPFKDFGTVEFRVPVLDELRLSRRHAHNPFIYPKVQASRIVWGLERPWDSQWQLNEIEPDLRAILLQYRSATELQIPSRFKERISAMIRELKSDDTWLSALSLIIGALAVLVSLIQMATHSTPADPPEICRKLEALQHQYKIIEDLRSRIRNAHLECARLETEISEHRASVAPIRRCPQELLLMFFEYYICENPRLIRHLLPVCKQWYELAISSPRLWNDVPIRLETDWDIESTCESIQKRLDKCIHFSGTASLELNLDFSGLIPPQGLIASQIREDVSKYTHPDGQDTLNEWISGLDVDLLNDPEVISACQPHHLFELLGNLIGDDGDIMPRWASLCLDLPQDPELALGILKLFSHPAPSLTHFQISWFEDMHEAFSSLIGTIFPDLPGLEHLEVPSVADLEFFNFNPTLVQSLTFNRLTSCDPSIFTSFTRLQELVVHSWFTHRPEEGALSRGVIQLPELRRLVVRGVVPNFDTFEFRVPLLDELYLSRHYMTDPFTYPKVQASKIVWAIEGPWASQWTLDQIEPDIRAIILKYRSVTELQFPSRLKERILSLIRELKSDDTWLSALRLVSLRALDGTTSERIEV
ncbi:hypothetical protein M408DRAFT_30048 [Serendipita vermifera MAFF 305830]|uniref:F-box domain-containing protein n=1 Tax=Serendipita vermifera MAFF 305830 TaxID=933852 RepID=A0A0C3ALC9_SERVB|nr:hypothetical protein M408DRAFT_30048 [Serendipita vermifera MAFF 305830]